jgi:ATP-dependent helicase/nuclease subunit A
MSGAFPAGASAPTLTPEQERAVSRRGEPLALSAAAGSGKTSVLVERFVRAVREDGVPPARILAITFTDRAAGELRERVRARLLELGERDAARDTEGAFVSTFHGFCARLLRSHALLAGLDPDFAILEEALASRLRERAFQGALRDFLEGERAEAVDLIGAYGVDRVSAMIDDVHARLRSRGERLPRLPALRIGGSADRDDRDGAAACALLGELLERFGAAYEALKGARSAVDFDDLELRAREVLSEHASVRAAWSGRFELLMVDEFQDTNPRQLGILRALDRGNLFTVGDELQSIYGFRHADVELFRARRDELGARGGSLALTHNFRGRPPLLEVVNTAFAKRFAAFTPLVAARVDAVAGAGQGAAANAPAADADPLVELLLTAKGGWDDSEEVGRRIAGGLHPAALWRQAEARLLAQRVAELVRSGRARAGEVAVLLRACGDIEVYERALQLQGMRTLAAVGGFWAHQQIGDLLAYLRALANPLDEQALYGVLASPLVGLSRDGMALLARAARAHGGGVWETVSSSAAEALLSDLPERERRALLEFCARLEGERSRASQSTISELIERAVDAGGYRAHVLGLDWGERRLANVHKLLRLARRFEASEGRDLRGFLDHAGHLQQTVGDRESDAPVDGVDPDAVRLMSIHAAKGLEFPVVCIADLGRAPNLRPPDLLVDGERIGLALLRLDAQKATPALDYEDLREDRRRADAEEEDRILYVAMTRARERLLLSGAVDFERWREQRPGASAISWLARALAAELPEVLGDAVPAPLHDLLADPSGVARVRCLLSAPATLGSVLRLESIDAEAPSVPASMRGGEGNERTEQPLETDGAVRGPRGVGARPRGMDSFSYSSLSELERCGYRYYLERVLGLGEDRPPARSRSDAAGLEARARGTLIHRLLEGLDFARSTAPSAGQVAAIARELGLRPDKLEREEIASLLAQAIRAAPAARVAAATRVRREQPFAFSLGSQQPLITGVIDLIAHEANGRCLVLDYKSDRVSEGDDLTALVERDYGLQRLLYALAVLRDDAGEVEIVHWFLHRPHEPVGARYRAEERGGLEQRLAALLAQARAHTFNVSPRPHRGLCLTCPGRGSLCSWDEQHTMREHPGLDPASPSALAQPA